MAWSHRHKRARNFGALFLLSLSLAASPLLGQDKTQGDDADPAKKKPALPSTSGAVEVRLVDDSTLKLLLRDERIELETAYGKLLIPVADIQRIDIGLRTPDDLRKKIDTALADLGSGDFRRRQAATAELIDLREKAYPSLVAAAKGKDTEKTGRIEQILEKIRDAVPAEILEIPPYDVVQTADSRIAGRIKADVLRVGTLAFGEQQVKLTDIRTLRAQNVRDVDAPADGTVLDAGSVRLMQHQIGKTMSFRVTGPPAAMAMQMGVFGTDVYTIDSSLEAAALHAGVVQPGKTAVIRVTFVGPQQGFTPSVRNGVSSHGYGPWNGFRIEQPRGGKK